MTDSTSNVSGVAERYANALFELALDTNSLPVVENDLGRFAGLKLDTGPVVTRVGESEGPIG